MFLLHSLNSAAKVAVVVFFGDNSEPFGVLFFSAGFGMTFYINTSQLSQTRINVFGSTAIFAPVGRMILT